ncbi:glycerophosphodiester phosphodiesterase [Salinirubellus salinus]|uniref:Glycerophosphodiester phosphodiesterase n=1 Tax=Salinirubellus salinus TaxID=1364945 RepID=A0A9E7R139_9EURY|nr:glycerophosphodiester phosphodiesterase [Salinirubellus salinus]UWM53682.1 glycerophosphodiester phosphodiesterase [Salinirubellus salinus]
MSLDILAHRGFAGTFPENTVPAVTAAGLHPDTHTVEVDTMPAADGTPVVFHDSRLDERDDGSEGVTDAEGVVWETPLATVTGAEVLGSGFTVPTLAAVVEALPPGVRLNVELKNPGTRDVWPASHPDDLATRRETWRPFVERVAATCEPLERVLYSSFFEAALAAADDVTGDRTAPVVPDGAADWGLDCVARHGCTAFHPAKEAVFTDAALVGRARDRGCTVNAWTARTWHDVKRLREAGVDGVVADYPLLTIAGDR